MSNLAMQTARTRMTQHVERSTLASSTARRQIAQLAWSFGGVVTLVLSYGIGTGLYRMGVVTHQFPQTVLWCVLPYLLAAHWIYHGIGFPVAERASLLLVTTVTPFLLLLLFFALLQQPYSRGAVLLVYTLSTGWFVLGDWIGRRHQRQRLVYLDAGIPDVLESFCGRGSLASRVIELRPWPEDGQACDSLLDIDGVVLDRHATATATRNQLLVRLKLNHVRLYSIEAVAELLSGRKMLPKVEDDLWQMDGKPAYDLAKRGMDVALVVVTLPLWLALCGVVGVAVKLSSPGPVLFSQIRVGRDGHSFRLWKFRSMRYEPQPTSARFAQVHDDRITPVGRVIRRWRLDELPQLFNVLLGHMSLIGPRPEQAEFVDAFASRIPAYTYRHLVRPGLTGWAQMQQGYADSEEGAAVKLSYDLYYVANYSVALDLLIIYKTIRIVFSGFGSR